MFGSPLCEGIFLSVALALLDLDYLNTFEAVGLTQKLPRVM